MTSKLQQLSGTFLSQLNKVFVQQKLIQEEKKYEITEIMRCLHFGSNRPFIYWEEMFDLFMLLTKENIL
jgi:hypothetical protein